MERSVGALHFFVLGVETDESDETMRCRGADKQMSRLSNKRTSGQGGRNDEQTSGLADKRTKGSGVCGVWVCGELLESEREVLI